MTARQNCCTHCLGIWLCKLVFAMDSCTELPVLLPHADQAAGSLPVSMMLSSLNSATFVRLLQLLGTLPLKLLQDTLNTLMLGAKVGGNTPGPEVV